MAAGLHISISAETITHIGGFPFTNSMLASVFVTGIILATAVYFYLTYKPSSKPQGFHNIIEMIIESLYGLVQGVTQSKKKTELFFPYIATFFIFICLNNWFGLLPGVGSIGFYEEEPSNHGTAQSIVPVVQAAEDGHVQQEEPEMPTAAAAEIESTPTSTTKVFVPYLRAGTADLNMTIALAIISQIMAQVFGFSYVGFSYLKKFFNFSNPIMTFVGLLELMGEFTKVVSYAFRLFGNVFAGEVLLIVITYLTKVVVPMPFYGLELFVGAIQALVFAMLSLVFFNTATISHDEH
ncbi:MAG: F0F1 ATP synthase subunit A [Patescibacteria group bacterium]